MAKVSSQVRADGQLQKVLEATKSKYDKQLKHSRTEAEKHLSRAKSIETDLKALRADIDIAVHGMPMSVSLLHKVISGTAYIKARCWWHGKQREVQIGTIPAVLERIGEMSSNPGLSDATDLTWEEVKSNKEIVESIKDIAREKLRHYIIKRLLADYQAATPGEETQRDAKSDTVADPELDSDTSDGADWYAQWGMANQYAENQT
ncbi:hypothetical protein ACFL6E_02960 [Candidatus Neomarinimicrobiota bacterium]